MTCARAGRFYGLRRFELPVAFAAVIFVHLLEVGGMRAALAEGRAEKCGSVLVASAEARS